MVYFEDHDIYVCNEAFLAHTSIKLIIRFNAVNIIAIFCSHNQLNIAPTYNRYNLDRDRDYNYGYGFDDFDYEFQFDAMVRVLCALAINARVMSAILLLT